MAWLQPYYSDTWSGSDAHDGLGICNLHLSTLTLCLVLGSICFLLCSISKYTIIKSLRFLLVTIAHGLDLIALILEHTKHIVLLSLP